MRDPRVSVCGRSSASLIPGFLVARRWSVQAVGELTSSECGGTGGTAPCSSAPYASGSPGSMRMVLAFHVKCLIFNILCKA